MLLFRSKYPGWWFDWNLELTRFSTRVGAYFALLDDDYPSTDEEQSVHLDRSAGRRRAVARLPLIKWLLAIPHYIVLGILGIALFFMVIFAWFAILFTGRYPRGAFEFVVGVFRWSLRVTAYAFILTTDRYPPFSIGDEGPALGQWVAFVARALDNHPVSMDAEVVGFLRDVAPFDTLGGAPLEGVKRRDVSQEAHDFGVHTHGVIV